MPVRTKGQSLTVHGGSTTACGDTTAGIWVPDAEADDILSRPMLSGIVIPV